MSDDILQDLMEEYIFQRQNGVNQQDVIQLLARMQPNLSGKQLQALKHWIQEWETERQISQETEDTRPVTQAELALVQSPSTIACPNCGKDNPEDAKYCYACGSLIPPQDSGSTGQLYEEVNDASTFGNLATLVISVRGHDNNLLYVEVGDGPMVIGRSDTNSPERPDVDLFSYGAKEKGVSRQHAILRRADHTLTIQDNNSVNHTFINGERIHPHEVRVIHDGDEIRFGHLLTRFSFQRELRRL